MSVTPWHGRRQWTVDDPSDSGLTIAEETGLHKLPEVNLRIDPKYYLNPWWNIRDSDKWNHEYFVLYYEYLKQYIEREIRILDIGIFLGGSISYWSKCLPNAQVFAADCNYRPNDSWHDEILQPVYGPPSTNETSPTNKFGMTKEQVNRTRLMYYDSTSASEKNRIMSAVMDTPHFKVIVDDGSHNPYAQLATYLNHIPNLDDDGVYFIEDVQAGRRGPHVKVLIDALKKECIENNRRLFFFRSSAWGIVNLVITNHDYDRQI